MFVPMAEQVARETRKDYEKRAEFHRLAKLAKADRLGRPTLLVESIKRVVGSVVRAYKPDVTKPVTE